MAPELKKYWLLLGLAILFLGIALAVPISVWPRKNLTAREMTVVGLSIILFTANAITLGVGMDNDDTRLIFYWCKVVHGSRVGRHSDTFPRTEDEREGMRTWAGRTLTLLATRSSLDKNSRESAKAVLDAYRQPVIAEQLHSPADLPARRRQLRIETLRKKTQLQLEYQNAADLAAKTFREYHRFWDLLKALGILPRDPNMGEPFPDPEAFRASVGTGVLEKPPAMQSIETPGAAAHLQPSQV